QPSLRRKTTIQRGLLLRAVARHVEGTRNANLAGMEGKTVGLHRLAIRREALARRFQRGELVEQQIVPPPRNLADRFRMPGTLPERRMRLLDRRRLHDDVVVLPVLACE